MKKRILSLLPLMLLLAAMLCTPAFALTESEVEAEVAASGRATVAGNVLIWFLCAVAFLKVSQKIDSFMASMGVNVGRTGGSLMAEAMIAARGVSMLVKAGGGAIGGIGKAVSGSSGGAASGSAGSPGASNGFFKGGIIGMAGRHITNSAVRTATSQTAAVHTAQKQSAVSATHTATTAQSAGIHTASSTHSGAHTASSVQSGGINSVGLVKSGGIHMPGGTQPDGGRTNTTGVIQTENSVQSASFQSDSSICSSQDHTSSESACDSSMFADSMVQQDGGICTVQESQPTTFSDSGSQIFTPESEPALPRVDLGPASQPGTIITAQPTSQPDTVSAAPPGGVSAPSSQTVNSQQVSHTSQVSQLVSSSRTLHAGRGSHTHTQSSGQSNAQAVRQASIGGAVFARSLASGGRFANDVIGTVARGDIRSAGSITGDLAAQSISSYMGYTALGTGAQDVPRYSDVEIGGGRITGTETPAGSKEGLAFGMYHATQYAVPEGPHEKVYSADGTLWYKQYAQDSVERRPYKAPDGSVAYNERIVKKLPTPPKRKDRL